MTAREVPEWIGAKPESMPGLRVLLRLYDKQDGKCACGCETPMSFERDQIDCDHVIPLKDGGENRERNLQLLLRKHHIIKTNAENVARGIANQHKAKAFTVVAERKPKLHGRGFAKAKPQRTATRPIIRKSEMPR